MRVADALHLLLPFETTFWILCFGKKPELLFRSCRSLCHVCQKPALETTHGKMLQTNHFPKHSTRTGGNGFNVCTPPILPWQHHVVASVASKKAPRLQANSECWTSTIWEILLGKQWLKEAADCQEIHAVLPVPLLISLDDFLMSFNSFLPVFAYLQNALINTFLLKAL